MRRTNKRLGLFMGLAVLFFFGLFGRAFYLQVVAAPGLQRQADAHTTRTVELNARRGTIFDRNGQPLAISEAMCTVYATPSEVTNVSTAAAELAPILGLSQSELLEKLSGDEGFRYVVRRVDPSVGEALEAKLEEIKTAGTIIKGITVISEDKRVYPKGALAPQVLGFVGR